MEKTSNKKNVLGWLLFLPSAFGLQAVGSLALGLLFIGIGLKNQVFLDGVSAFVGNFLFTFCAGYFAPSKRIKITEIVFLITGFFAILSLILGLLGVYTSAQMPTPNSIIPVLQIFGSMYAVVLFPPLITPHTTLDILWRKIAGLGGGTTFLGGIILIIGIVIGIIAKTWGVVFIGLIILVIGVITWLFPYIHLFLRMRKIPNNK